MVMINVLVMTWQKKPDIAEPTVYPQSFQSNTDIVFINVYLLFIYLLIYLFI